MHINISNKELCIASLVTLSENKVSDIIHNVHVQILFTSLMFNFHVQSNVIHGVNVKVSMNFLISTTLMFNVHVSIQILFIVFMLECFNKFFYRTFYYQLGKDTSF